MDFFFSKVSKELGLVMAGEGEKFWRNGVTPEKELAVANENGETGLTELLKGRSVHGFTTSGSLGTSASTGSLRSRVGSSSRRSIRKSSDRMPSRQMCM